MTLTLIVFEGNGQRLYVWMSIPESDEALKTPPPNVKVRPATKDEIAANMHVYWGDDCPGDYDGVHFMDYGLSRCQLCGQPHPASEPQ